MKKEKPVDTCEHAKKRGRFGYCAACMIRLYRDEAVKRGAIILSQRKKMAQLRKSLRKVAKGWHNEECNEDPTQKYPNQWCAACTAMLALKPNR